MAIRKYGAATGKVTGIEQDSISREAAAQDRDPAWGDDDDRGLAAENQAADGSRDDD